MILNIFKKKVLFKAIFGLTATTVVVITPLSVIACVPTSDLNARPINWYSPVNTLDGTPNAFANDSCSILWDEDQKLFYSWMLFRNGKGFPSGWIEMTSPDLNTWTQGEYRIQQKREFDTINGKGSTSALGGSVWVDTDGKFFEPGDVVFVVSMQPSRILTPKNEPEGQVLIGDNSSSNGDNSSSNGLVGIDKNNGDEEIISNSNITDESGIAYFVSHGLGQDFYKKGVLSKENLSKPTDNTNWRDTFVFQTDDGVYFAISAHNRLEFWKINSFEDNEKGGKNKIEKVSELFVRNIGVEVPNVVKIGENLWYVSASVQDNPFGGPFQSAWWTLCEWNAEKGFIPVTIGDDGNYHQVENFRTAEAALKIEEEFPDDKVIDWDKTKNEDYKEMVNIWQANEYGTEGYAQRVSDPYQTQNQRDKKFAEFAISRSMVSNWAYDTDIWAWKGGSYGSEKLTFKDGKPNLVMNDKVETLVDNGTAVYNLKGSDLVDGYSLDFNNKLFSFYLKDNITQWENNVSTKLKKWNNKGGPTDLTDDITIVWNKCTLTFYNETKGWNAHFMLPQWTIHEIKEGAKSISSGNLIEPEL
ncbi:hypothetical protein EELLY_v1c01330 [Entomoplasma ellychniae]|uniref:Glycosyl hydrolase family 32 N-terminal domain-containing protein n=1 Tax=Entomoplasma ellychniae TaxID=2114 RepID=A0A8E2UDU9_9MOLU|nr:hypothetical protein [Entomoplasma ellychniae]PPE04458.1 hypothetical protein EELLY_v1c01330 [Entomoplasma ellychniae]